MSRSHFAYPPSLRFLLGAVAIGAVVYSPHAQAQDAGAQSASQTANTGGYGVGESDVPDPAATTANANAGPVRMARFSYLQGNVTWRADVSTDWADANNNLPLKQGAQIWVADGGRAEIQFDDGSYLRLGSGAIATIQVLFSDAEGEFTEIKQTNGVSMLQIKHDRSVYQVDTPLISARADGPARLRVGVGSDAEVGVPQGSVSIEGAQGKAALKSGDFLVARDATSPFSIRPLPAADNWEQWNQDRGTSLDASARILAQHNFPANIALVAGDLDKYGTWRTDPTYGDVWVPTVSDNNWRPYSAGHWVWVNPFGWTWCSDEPWGWAPYHYGTWFHADYGWAWQPGPVNQYWSPAVVHFTENGGNIAWCPLAPSEVHYPPASTFALGFRGASWSAYYSIGQAGCYYPSGDRYCVGRAFNTVVVNRTSYMTFVQNPNASSPGAPAMTRSIGFAANNNSYREGRPFVPINASGAAGVTASTQAAFGGKGSFTAVASGSTDLFLHGRTIGPPTAGRPTIAGPPMVHPTESALVPTRGFVRSASATPSSTNKPVFRTPITEVIGRTSQGPHPNGPVGDTGKSKDPVTGKDKTTGKPKTPPKDNGKGKTDNKDKDKDKDKNGKS